MTAESSLNEARRAIAEFPGKGSVALLIEAVNETIAIKSGLDIEIPRPSPAEISPIDRAIKHNIRHLLLVYLPGLRPYSRYPEMFRDRLSSEGFSRLNPDSLVVQSGWRVIDARKPGSHFGYEDDENFLEAIVGAARRDGEIPNTEELDFAVVPNQSRMSLIPLEIAAVIAPKVEDLLGMPRGSMRLPNVREAMITSFLYGFVSADVQEWQTARILGEESNRFHPAGLIYTHSSSVDPINYYDVRVQSKHIHYPHTGFRLQGMIPNN